MTRILSFLSLLFLVPSIASTQLDCIVRTDEDHQWQVASRNALDYAALAELLEK